MYAVPRRSRRTTRTHTAHDTCVGSCTAWRRRLGITLLELIVVVVVLAILSAIAIPTFLSTIGKSKYAALETTASAIGKDATALALATQSAPTQTDAAYTPSPPLPTGGSTPDRATKTFVMAAAQETHEPGLVISRYATLAGKYTLSGNGLPVCLSVPTSDGTDAVTVTPGACKSTTAPVPSLSGISPDTGTTTGGTAVTLSGSNFATGDRVLFGTMQAASVTVASSTSITGIAPAHAAGAVTVTVQNGAGQGSGSATFTYLGSVEYVSGSLNYTTGTSIVVGRPGTVEPGEVLVAYLVAAGGVASRTFGAPAGWTALVPTYYDHSTSEVFWHVETTTEPTSYTFTIAGTSAARLTGAIFNIAGATTASPLDVSATATGTTTAVAWARPTTTAPNDLILLGVTTYTKATYTTPAGTTARLSHSATTYDLATFTAPQATAGQVAAYTSTASTVYQGWTALTIAIKP